jgi:hypothetical protein
LGLQHLPSRKLMSIPEWSVRWLRPIWFAGTQTGSALQPFVTQFVTRLACPKPRLTLTNVRGSFTKITNMEVYREGTLGTVLPKPKRIP